MQITQEANLHPVIQTLAKDRYAVIHQNHQAVPLLVRFFVNQRLPRLA